MFWLFLYLLYLRRGEWFCAMLKKYDEMAAF